jgi:stage III sporulation protein AH
MNKKQAAIIVTLLALIVCAGILATKASTENPFYVNVSDVDKSGSGAKTDDKKATTSTFSEMRLIREKSDASTIQTLKTIVDDKNTPSDGKNDATKKMTNITTGTRLESRIEEQLKLGGFNDVFCYIDENKAKVVVNSKEKLNDKQTKQINSVVMDVAKIRDVTIDVKQ